MSVSSTRKFTRALAGGYLQIPAAYGYTTVTPGTGAYGSWVEFIASTTTEIAIVGVAASGITTAAITLDIGTGAGGAETTIASIPLGELRSVEPGLGMMFPFPIIVPASTRVAVRLAATTANGVPLALSYIPTGYLA